MPLHGPGPVWSCSHFLTVFEGTTREFISGKTSTRIIHRALERQETNIQSAEIVASVMFCLEKFVMGADRTKKRMKLVIEGTNTSIYMHL